VHHVHLERQRHLGLRSFDRRNPPGLVRRQSQGTVGAEPCAKALRWAAIEALYLGVPSMPSQECRWQEDPRSEWEFQAGAALMTDVFIKADERMRTRAMS